MRSRPDRAPGPDIDTRRALLLLAGTAATTRGLIVSGDLLGPLPSFDGHGLVHWLGSNPPLDSLAHLGCWVGLGTCAYLAVTTLAALAAHCWDRPRLSAIVDAVTIPLLRRGLTAAAAATVVASGTFTITSATATGAAFAGPGDRGVATMELIEPDSPSPTATTVAPPVPEPESTLVRPSAPTTASTTPSVGGGGTAMIRRLDDGSLPDEPRPDGSVPDASTDPDQDVPSPAPPDDRIRANSDVDVASIAPAGDAEAGGGTWTIQPGDHLWHVAETTLATTWGRPPSTGETASYLRELIQANLDELVVPGDPDLVFAGQVFTLPDPATPWVGRS